MKTNLQISFFSIATSTEISFNAFVIQFNDSYKMEWNSESVFGRMDPIATYKNTSRAITCGFTIPADDEKEAVDNHNKFTTLLSLMYPNYSVNNNNATIASVPLFKVKYANLIMNADSSTPNSIADQSATTSGLLGYFNDFKYDPNMDSNVFVKNGAIYRQSLNCTFTFNVLHTHRLGFDANTVGGKIKQFTKGFPYKQDTSKILGE